MTPQPSNPLPAWNDDAMTIALAFVVVGLVLLVLA